MTNLIISCSSKDTIPVVLNKTGCAPVVICPIMPYPDACNLSLSFNTNKTYELRSGNTVKALGNYAIDSLDLTTLDQTAFWGPPPYPHNYKMHLTLQPDPVISDFIDPGRWPEKLYLAGLLNLSSDCLEFSHWGKDIHGFEYTSGSKFVRSK